MAEVASGELFEEPSDYGALKPGNRLGRYELLVPIARGGMARVWAARLHGQRGFQKLVAIKTILPHLANEPEFERMFLDEARIASGVHHPNVCEIYELGEEARVLYLAMEWVSGDSFSRMLRPNGKTEAIDPRVAARIVADACAGLHAAHEQKDDSGRLLGVVHRDLSPHNILLTADGVAKVADFGVAKALGQLHEATSAGQLKGKVAYMSPEQISGATIDRRSDIFALGCVLYEATTGERPFKGENDAQVMHAVLEGRPLQPSRLVRGYPPELERIVLSAVSAQSSLRYATAEEMRFALEKFLTHGAVVTQSNVAQIIDARIGKLLGARRDRIRQASTAGDQGAFDPLRESSPDAHRSGVKQAQGRLGATMPLGQSSPYTPSPLYTPQPYTGTGPQLPPGMSPQAMTPSPPHGQPPVPMPPGALDATRIGEWSQAGLVLRPGVGMAAGSSSPAILNQPLPEPSSPDAAPPDGRQYMLAAGIGIVFALMISIGSFLIYASQKARHREPTPAAATSATPVPVPVPMPVAPPTTATTAPSAEIALRVTPPEARIVIGGSELGPGVRTVPRPAAGTTVPIVVRADGYVDTTLLVDATTVSPVDVTLAKKSAAEPAPSEAPTAETTATAHTRTSKPRPKSGSGSGSGSGSKGGDPALPPNPF